MEWTISFVPNTQRDLNRLEPQLQVRIIEFLEKRIVRRGSSRALGKALKSFGDKLWRYRVGDFRVTVRINDEDRNILVL